MPRNRLAVVCATLLLLCPTGVGAQARAPGPTLLRRLAEAVDGNRTGDSVFVVAAYDSLSPVAGVFPSRAAARALVSRLGPRFDVFGPFLSDILELPEPRIIEGCVHDGGRSVWSPPPSICPETAHLKANVESMALLIRMIDGTTRTMRVPVEADAIFLTIPAIDKFVLPYYAKIIGVEGAAAMRADIMSRYGRP